MMTPRHVRGTAVAGLVCLALAGCASSVASSSAQARGTAAASSAVSPGTSGTAVGCASVSQATSVAVHRSMHLIQPDRPGTLDVTQRKPATVQALFRGFCNAVSHPDKARGAMSCPADFGTQYTGTFYDGTRTLARFLYTASGCQRVSLISGSKTQSTLMFVNATKAAPNLQADMAAVLGVPVSQVAQPATGAVDTATPGTTVNPGGPNKPAGTSKPLR